MSGAVKSYDFSVHAPGDFSKFILQVRKILLFDTEAKNGGFLDLSGSKKTRECKAI